MNQMINRTRSATVEVSSQSLGSKGTGFFIGPNHIATCFHVIAKGVPANGQTTWTWANDLSIKTESGEIINAALASVPNAQAQDPIIHDFAVLRLTTAPVQAVGTLALKQSNNPPSVGDEVLFSGHPLASPAMITHKGMVSGFDQTRSVVCIQGAINKGNSGGALCDSAGEVIGIISRREGGISQSLDEVCEHIQSLGGGVAIMGVNPLAVIQELAINLNNYISTGIGYANSIRFLRDYVRLHPDLLL